MKALLATFFVILVAGSASAQSGLSGAIDRQRQDMATQQAETRREIQRQQGSLQQQQDQNLQFQLLQRHQSNPPPPTVRHCVVISGTLFCQ